MTENKAVKIIATGLLAGLALGSGLETMLHVRDIPIRDPILSIFTTSGLICGVAVAAIDYLANKTQQALNNYKQKNSSETVYEDSNLKIKEKGDKVEIKYDNGRNRVYIKGMDKKTNFDLYVD